MADSPFKQCNCGTTFRGEYCPGCAAEDRLKAMQADCLQPMVDRTLKVMADRGIKHTELRPLPERQAEQIGALICRVGQLERENVELGRLNAEQAEMLRIAEGETGQSAQLQRELKGTEDAMDSIVRADNGTIAQLEREKEALRESRDHWVDVAADLAARLLSAGPHEDPATFPANALKHSR